MHAGIRSIISLISLIRKTRKKNIVIDLSMSAYVNVEVKLARLS